MNVNPVGMYNNNLCPDCSKKNNSPAFGMAIKFKDPAIARLKKTLSHSTQEVRDSFSKEINPLIKKSENNPVHIIVDAVPDNEYLLKATVQDKSLGTIAEYTQDAIFDYGFLKDGVKRADQINKLNSDLDSLK